MFQKALEIGLLLGIIGAIIGFILALASNIFRIETDQRLGKIIKALPNMNCGGCGYPGCAGMAEAILKGEADVRKCKPANELTYEKIKAILDGEESVETAV